ncbi:MAG: DUF2165 family protein [Pseudomonadota bacterium]
MEVVIVLGQAVFTGLLAGWLAIGVYENIREPRVNRELVEAVLNMEAVRAENQQVYELTKGNRITSPAFHTLAFKAIVLAELVATALLVLGTLMLLGAVIGVVATEMARSVAALGTVAFTAIWGGMLVGGQWVHYWVGTLNVQFTHYFMTIWGVVTFLALVLP